jgi:hypothetical protein
LAGSVPSVSRLQRVRGIVVWSVVLCVIAFSEDDDDDDGQPRVIALALLILVLPVLGYAIV